MLRLFFEKSIKAGSEIILTESLFRHACVVMRLKEGDSLKLFNHTDGEFDIKLTHVKKKEAIAVALHQTSTPKQTRALHLAFSPLKPERMFFMIEKAVELGVTDFHPLLMQHTQHAKCPLDKWQDQAIQAVQQSERFTVPTFHAPEKLSVFLKNHTDPLIFTALERAANRPNPLEAFQKYEEKQAIFLIGPEGGFSAQEVVMLESLSNVVPVTLGEYILRAETAALTMVALYKGVSK